jgi:hypothetical protein
MPPAGPPGGLSEGRGEAPPGPPVSLRESWLQLISYNEFFYKPHATYSSICLI